MSDYIKSKSTETLICDSLDNIQMMPETEKEEILQCIKTIMTTTAGECPMCREIGVSKDALHRRDATAKVMLTRDIFVAVQDQETRVNLKTVDFDENGNSGILNARLEVEMDG